MVSSFSSQSIAFAEEYVSWIDFSKLRTPVDRPVEELAFSLDGTRCSGNFKISVTHKEGSSAGNWKVDPANPSVKHATGSAVLRSMLRPDSITESGNTTIGVRIHFNTSKATTLGFEVFEKVNPQSGFQRPAKKIGFCKKNVKAGKQDLILLWRDAGVKDEAVSNVNGYGLVTYEAPFAMDIFKVDLVFASKVDADVFRKQRKIVLRELQKTEIETLVARSIDLNALFGRLSTDKMEAVIWQGYQVAAMYYQLEHWMPLAMKYYGQDKDGEALAKDRQALVVDLERRSVPQSRIDSLQSRIDLYIDNLIKILPMDARRWKVVADGFGFKPNGQPYDGRYHRPDGRPYRMFGPYFQRIRYSSPASKKNTFTGWKPWDMRHFAALGYNGARMDISWHRLEPKQGQFDQEYLKMVKQIFLEAEKYGLGISIDVHWAFPSWFIAGKPGYEIDRKKLSGFITKNNSYHWPEAQVSMWGRLAAELADVPNIVAFEVPNNEPVISVTREGIMDKPLLRYLWNNWLRETYGTRHNLDVVWGNAAVGADRYKLGEDENWEDASIRPMGFQDTDLISAYQYNPRLWDFLKWVGWMQTDLTDKIMKAIRKSIPDAVGIMQYTIGDRHDKGPVPLHYQAIQTVAGEHVVPGTHYGIGGVQAQKAATVTLLSYDSEQQMFNMDYAVQRHVEMGLGFCPYAYFFIGLGGRLLIDYEGHLRPDVAFLSRKADWIRNYWPEGQTTGTRVAIVRNTRLEATTGNLVKDLRSLLKEQACRVGLFEGLRIVQHPELLKGYDLVITASSYMDTDLLKVLDKQFDGSVLLFGRLDLDAYARKPANGLSAELAHRGIFLRDSSVKKFSESESGSIDLSGAWDWYFTGKHVKDPVVPPKNIPKDGWKKMMVPGEWGELKILGSQEFLIGDGWYRRKVVIPNIWKGQGLQLIMGAIDDEDWTFFNGHLVGKTTSETPDCYAVLRKYNIPSQIIRWGEENELFICNLNTYNIAGITTGPVEIIAEQMVKKLCWIEGGKGFGKVQYVRIGNNATHLDQNDLLENVQVLSRIGGTTQENPPAVIHQGRWFWWVQDSQWSKEEQTHKTVLKRVLSNLTK